MNYSNYQNAIFTEIETQTGHVMVQAVAGSGKSTTLIECMKRAKGNSLFVAFNKSIATELSTKVPSHVTACTLHSIGLKTITKNLGFVKVDNKKLVWIMNKIPATSFLTSMNGFEKSEVFKLRKQITDLVSIWKNTLIDYNNNEEVYKIADHYNINFDPDILGLARSVIVKSLSQTSSVDFDDMIYLPVALKLPMNKFDNVFVDECQDLNRSQIEMVLNMCKKPNGRIIAVGDSKQSIYGFRGADTNAMSRIKEVLNAKELPLSVSYRCPVSHVRLAQEIVDYILPGPEAIEGTIDYIKEESFISNVVEEVNPLILCRTNAPLISYAIKLIKVGKKAFVRGADIGNYLKGIVIGFNASGISEFNEKVNQWESTQLGLLEKRRASNAVKETIIDYADVLRAFSDQSSSPKDIEDMIDRIFSDNNEGIIFSSVHRAKGLEANNVYIIRPDQLPLVRNGQKEWEIEQEMNLKYVALTRSKNKLVFVLNKD
jgi:DNA helicase-2/ATP-dependent DNA helicase PcrA